MQRARDLDFEPLVDRAERFDGGPIRFGAAGGGEREFFSEGFGDIERVCGEVAQVDFVPKRELIGDRLEFVVESECVPRAVLDTKCV